MESTAATNKLCPYYFQSSGLYVWAAALKLLQGPRCTRTPWRAFRVWPLRWYAFVRLATMMYSSPVPCFLLFHCHGKQMILCAFFMKQHCQRVWLTTVRWNAVAPNCTRLLEVSGDGMLYVHVEVFLDVFASIPLSTMVWPEGSTTLYCSHWILEFYKIPVPPKQTLTPTVTHTVLCDCAFFPLTHIVHSCMHLVNKNSFENPVKVVMRYYLFQFCYIFPLSSYTPFIITLFLQKALPQCEHAKLSSRSWDRPNYLAAVALCHRFVFICRYVNMCFYIHVYACMKYFFQTSWQGL